MTSPELQPVFVSVRLNFSPNGEFLGLHPSLVYADEAKAIHVAQVNGDERSSGGTSKWVVVEYEPKRVVYGAELLEKSSGGSRNQIH